MAHNRELATAMVQVDRDHLGWLDSGIVPQIDLPEGSHHAVDQHTLQFTFGLWNAMSKLIREHAEAPLPAGKHLLPEVVATWNRDKGPINVTVAFKKCQVISLVTLLDHLEQFG